MVRTWLEVTFSFPSYRTLKQRIILNDIPETGRVILEERKILTAKEKRKKRQNKPEDLINLQFAPLLSFCSVRAIYKAIDSFQTSQVPYPGDDKDPGDLTRRF